MILQTSVKQAILDELFSEIENLHDSDFESIEFDKTTEQVVLKFDCVPYKGEYVAVVFVLNGANVVEAENTDDDLLSHSVVNFEIAEKKMRIHTGYGYRKINFENGILSITESQTSID
jgi:uncharacterized protein YuzB (UPF0349 family)